MFATQVRNEWYSLARDEARQIIRMRRSSRRNTSVAEMEQTFSDLFAALDRMLPAASRSSYALLQDMRAAPLLDNPAIEAALSSYVVRLASGWRRYAILVQTPIGKLQARRTGWMAQTGGPAVFSDELEALNYLQTPA